MKRRRGQPFLGTEPHNALPTGLLAFDRLPPIPLPIRAPGLRHRLVLRMPLDESYPGIQLTTARKAGDSLALTDIRLTLGVYTHVELPDCSAAIESLPAPPSGDEQTTRSVA